VQVKRANMDRNTIPLVPLHLTSLAILAPSNSPLFIHSFTGKSDELRHYHLAHAAVDVIEERSESRCLHISPGFAFQSSQAQAM